MSEYAGPSWAADMDKYAAESEWYKQQAKKAIEDTKQAIDDFLDAFGLKPKGPQYDKQREALREAGRELLSMAQWLAAEGYGYHLGLPNAAAGSWWQWHSDKGTGVITLTGDPVADEVTMYAIADRRTKLQAVEQALRDLMTSEMAVNRMVYGWDEHHDCDSFQQSWPDIRGAVGSTVQVNACKTQQDVKYGPPRVWYLGQADTIRELWSTLDESIKLTIAKVQAAGGALAVSLAQGGGKLIGGQVDLSLVTIPTAGGGSTTPPQKTPEEKAYAAYTLLSVLQGPNQAIATATYQCQGGDAVACQWLADTTGMQHGGAVPASPPPPEPAPTYPGSVPPPGVVLPPQLGEPETKVAAATWTDSAKTAAIGAGVAGGIGLAFWLIRRMLSR